MPEFFAEQVYLWSTFGKINIYASRSYTVDFTARSVRWRIITLGFQCLHLTAWGFIDQSKHGICLTIQFELVWIFREQKQKPMTTGWYFCHEFIVINWTSLINVHCYGSLTRATMQLTNFISFSSFSSPRGAINVNKTQFCASIDGINFCCANRCEPVYCSATFSLETLIHYYQNRTSLMRAHWY